MYTAYIDESGSNPSTRVFSIGGFAAHSIVWYQLENRWRRMLDRHKICVFHMADCQSGFGEFKDWPLERRHGLIREAIQLLTSFRELNGFSAALLVEDFNDLIKGDVKAVVGDHYSLCFQKCVYDLCIKAERLRKGEWLTFIVEEQPQFTGRIGELYEKICRKETWPNRHRLGSLQIGTKNDFVMLQTADIVAYEAFKQVDNSEFGQRPIRKSLQALLQLPFMGEYYNKQSFVEIISQLKQIGKL